MDVVKFWGIITPTLFINGDSVMLKRCLVLFFSLLAVGFSFQAFSQDGKAKATACFACHGEDGNGNASNALWPKLAGQNQKYLLKQMHDFKMQPGATRAKRVEPTMNGMIMSLQEQDFAAVAEYFSSLKTSHTVVEDKYLNMGQKIYRAGDAERKVAACTACHGPQGEGMPTAGFPALSGQSADYIIKQLKAFRAKSRDNDTNKVMRNVARIMSDEQMEAVAHYVGGLH